MRLLFFPSPKNSETIQLRYVDAQYRLIPCLKASSTLQHMSHIAVIKKQHLNMLMPITDSCICNVPTRFQFSEGHAEVQEKKSTALKTLHLIRHLRQAKRLQPPMIGMWFLSGHFRMVLFRFLANRTCFVI